MILERDERADLDSHLLISLPLTLLMLTINYSLERLFLIWSIYLSINKLCAAGHQVKRNQTIA